MPPDKGSDLSQVAVQNLFPISPETLNNRESITNPVVRRLPVGTADTNHGMQHRGRH